MPWQKTFDEEQAVEDALALFWSKGFVDTSIADLIAATGVNRGSLYNAFGDKRQLFIRALLHYERRYHRTLLSELEAIPDPRTAVAHFFERSVLESLADDGCKGCFIINTAAELPNCDKEVCAIVKGCLRDIEAFFLKQLERAQARGELSADTQPDQAAKALIGLATSIRVLGRGAFDEAGLRAIAGQAQRFFA